MPWLAVRKRAAPQSRARAVLVRVAAVSLALMLNALMLAIAGINPVWAYSAIFGGLFSAQSLAGIARRFIPIALCSYGLAFSYKAKVWNIGAEGQLVFGAIAGTWLALYAAPPPGLGLPLLYIIGFIAGGLWALMPALAKAFLGASEVLTTFMLNLISVKLLEYLVYGPWKGPGEWGFPQTSPFPPHMCLPLIPGTDVHYTTLVIVALAAALLYVIDRKTALGYEIRVVGGNVEAARYAGINIPKIVVFTMFVSGGLAGVAGVGEVAGVQKRLRPNISPGYGYTAIVVTWLGGLNPLGILVAAFMYSVLLLGNDVLKIVAQVPVAVTNMFNGILLLTLASFTLLEEYEVKVGVSRL